MNELPNPATHTRQTVEVSLTLDQRIGTVMTLGICSCADPVELAQAAAAFIEALRQLLLVQAALMKRQLH